MKARAGNSLTKWDFQITNKTDWVEMGFLNYKRESRFTIHPIIKQMCRVIPKNVEKTY